MNTFYRNNNFFYLFICKINKRGKTGTRISPYNKETESTYKSVCAYFLEGTQLILNEINELGPASALRVVSRSPHNTPPFSFINKRKYITSLFRWSTLTLQHQHITNFTIFFYIFHRKLAIDIFTRFIAFKGNFYEHVKDMQLLF